MLFYAFFDLCLFFVICSACFFFVHLFCLLDFKFFLAVFTRGYPKHRNE